MDFTGDVLASDAFLAEFQQDEELNQHQKNRQTNRQLLRIGI